MSDSIEAEVSAPRRPAPEYAGWAAIVLCAALFAVAGAVTNLVAVRSPAMVGTLGVDPGANILLVAAACCLLAGAGVLLVSERIRIASSAVASGAGLVTVALAWVLIRVLNLRQKLTLAPTYAKDLDKDNDQYPITGYTFAPGKGFWFAVVALIIAVVMLVVLVRRVRPGTLRPS